MKTAMIITAAMFLWAAPATACGVNSECQSDSFCDLSSSTCVPKPKIPKPLTLAWIKAQLKEHAPKYVVSVLFLDQADPYDELMSHIDSGQSDWIALAPTLAPGTDAGATLMLMLSLAEALPKNPVAVLSVLAPDEVAVAPESVCNAGFIETPKGGFLAYIRRAQSAVRRVKDVRLAKRKSECLGFLQQALIRCSKRSCDTPP
jgi:hypothetical protein